MNCLSDTKAQVQLFDRWCNATRGDPSVCVMYMYYLLVRSIILLLIIVNICSFVL